MPATLDDALSYVDRGWALLPVESGSKHPNHAVLRRVYGRTGWQKLAQRAASAPEVQAWFECDPATGVGVFTGAPSGVVVRDFDDGLPEMLPETPIVRTARGAHCYFRADGPIKTRRLADGELRGDGGYCVAPPSRHATGVEYAWLRDLSTPMLDLDDELLALVSGPVGSSLNSSSGRLTDQGRTTLVCTAAEAVGEAAGEVCRDGAWVARAAAVVGARMPGKFCCVLPGHEERRPSATLWRDPSGLYVYRCFHYRGGPQMLGLPALYATVFSGHYRERNRSELRRWLLRLRAAAGDLEPVALDVPRLPGLSDDERRALAGFVLLLGLRYADGDCGPAPYTRRFGPDWCAIERRPMPRQRFEDAKGGLIRRGLLVKVGEHASGFAHPTSLYTLTGLEGLS